MFTGLVEEVGQIEALQITQNTALLAVHAPHVHQQAEIGDSIAINGCCLTVVKCEKDLLYFDAVPETMRCTNLGLLQAGSQVNLERPLQAGARLGGHFVQGHVDGVGTILKTYAEENAMVFEIEAPPALQRYLIAKGSVAVDGVSLTVARLLPNGFAVWIIPHTAEATTFGQRRPGDVVNLECDVLGKYVERLLQQRE